MVTSSGKTSDKSVTLSEQDKKNTPTGTTGADDTSPKSVIPSESKQKNTPPRTVDPNEYKLPPAPESSESSTR